MITFQFQVLVGWSSWLWTWAGQSPDTRRLWWFFVCCCAISQWSKFQGLSDWMVPKDLSLSPVKFHSIIGLTTPLLCCASWFISEQLPWSHHRPTLHNTTRIFTWNTPAARSDLHSARYFSHSASVRTSIRVGHLSRYSWKIREGLLARSAHACARWGGKFAIRTSAAVGSKYS